VEVDRVYHGDHVTSSSHCSHSKSICPQANPNATYRGFLALFLCLFFLEETYPPQILVAKATDLRRITKNWGIHAKQQEIEVNFIELVEKNFSRPLKLLFSELTIFLLSLYTAFV
jgi:DHA1 family multidrug resistance protein-like MFS transporter